MEAVAAEALLPNGQLRTGLLHPPTGIFVYADYKAGRSVTLVPFTTGRGKPEYIRCNPT